MSAGGSALVSGGCLLKRHTGGLGVAPFVKLLGVFSRGSHSAVSVVVSN